MKQACEGVVRCYFASKPYVAFWLSALGYVVYVLGNVVYRPPALILVIGPFILVGMAIARPLVRDLVRPGPKLIVASDRIIYADWPFKELSFADIGQADLVMSPAAGLSRIHFEVSKEKELLNTYGFVSKVILRMHRASGHAPIVVNLATLRGAKSREVFEAITSRIARAKSGE